MFCNIDHRKISAMFGLEILLDEKDIYIYWRTYVQICRTLQPGTHVGHISFLGFHLRCLAQVLAHDSYLQEVLSTPLTSTNDRLLASVFFYIF